METTKPASTRSPTLLSGEISEEVSIVMVSYWTGPILFEAINAALDHTQAGVKELVLVDNGNKRSVIEKLFRYAEENPKLRVISGHGNVGFARGCNIGSDAALGRYLLLLNPDCCLSEKAVANLLAEAFSRKGHWMFGGRVCDPNGRAQRGSKRSLLTPITALVSAIHLATVAPRLFRKFDLNQHHIPATKTTRVEAITGACMMLPIETYKEFKGLDEGYFLHVEDLDFCMRLHKAKVPIFYVPTAEAIHHASSSQASRVWVEWQKAKGFFRYFWKHYRGGGWSIILVPLSIGLLTRLGIKSAFILIRTGIKSVFNSRGSQTS